MWCWAQTNSVVRGAAVMFQHLEAVSLRRAVRLNDGALSCLAGACGACLKVRNCKLPAVVTHSTGV